MRNHVPKLCRHKHKALGYATIDGKPVYFGPWPAHLKRPPHAVQQAYDAAIAKLLLARGNPRPVHVNSPTVDVLWDRYRAHADGYYRKGGKPTSEVAAIRTACRVAARLFGTLPAGEFGYDQLREVRDEFVRLGWCRESCNDQVSRVRRMFKWGAREKLVPVSLPGELALLEPLKKGRTPAREMPDVKPVEWSLVEATLPHLNPVLAAMARVHYLLGCRSEDVCPMRPCELDRTGGVWLYRPDSWKTEHLSRGEWDRLTYWVGPQAQAVLAPLLEQCCSKDDFVFHTRSVRGHSPRRSGCYSTGSYRTAIKRACKKHGLPVWTPHRLRHSKLTEIGNRYGVEMAQTVAGHKDLSTTAIYAQRNREQARRIMAEIG